MATSDIEICNSGLSKIGAQRIIAFTDDLEEARLCKTLYPTVRDKLLRSHPWRFAVKRVALGALVDAPLFDYEYAYQLPDDCLRVLDTNYPPEDWRQEGSSILSHDSGMSIKYISRVTDVSKFDANFTEVLAYQLAMELAFPLTQNASLAAGLEQRMLRELREARSFNAQIGSVESVEVDSWITVRY